VNPTLLLVLSAICPVSTPVKGAPGLTTVARLPASEAMQQNGDGKQLYRQERWNEAREKYQAALAADPELLGAQLNIACSYSRQGRYAEAADEAVKLIRQSFVPWAREVQEAADLGILQTQPVYAKIQTAHSEAAAEWGMRLRDGVFFVARTKPPVKVEGEGILVLRLNQEIFAWIPETGRFFQVTSEDGRVLAFAISADKRRLAYLLAGKLSRSQGQPPLVRGLVLRVLDLPTMSQSPSLPIPGDVKRIQLWFSSAPELKITDASGENTMFKVVNGVLEKGSSQTTKVPADAVVLTGTGVESPKRQVKKADCRFDLTSRMDSEGIMRIEVRRPGGKPFQLDTRYDAGLEGLPFSRKPPSPAAQPSVGKGKRME
jgi:hypothetical protein